MEVRKVVMYVSSLDQRNTHAVNWGQESRLPSVQKHGRMSGSFCTLMEGGQVLFISNGIWRENNS